MKKFLLFFGLLCAINLMFAQETVMIHQNGRDFQVSAVRSVTNYPASNIQFWVGTGSNSIVVVFQWCEEETMGIAYGYRWDGTATIGDMFTALDAADSRLTISTSGPSVITYSYQDDTYNEDLTAYGSLIYTLNGTWCGGLTDVLVNNGYFEMQEWGDCDLPTTNIIPATDPNGGDTPPTPPTPPTPTFTADDIHYWVGTGDASAIVAVSWDEDEVALAWGVHYDDEWYPSVIDLLDSIKTYDPRFDYHVSYYMSSPYNISSISFTEGNLTLSQTNTSNIMVRVFTDDHYDAVSGEELEDYSIWDGDFVEISTAGLFDFSDLEAVEPPAEPVEPAELCNTIHPLTYSEDFSSYAADQTMRPIYASAPIPECWTVVGNGTVHHVGSGTSDNADYFGGVGYSTSTNNFGAIAVNDAYFAFIASQIYTGTNANHINDMNVTGTRRYAILPPFDQPLSQTILTFDHRTNMADANTHLSVGYIVNDTADFVALEIYTADNKVLHHDTIRFSQYAGIPDNARLTMMWDVASTTASATGPGNRYCGIDNLIVALDVTDTTPVTEDPVDATIALNDILYWVGSGNNSAALIVSYAEPEVALAWGVHFDGSISATDMLDSVQAADPRFWYVGNPSNGGDIHFVTDDGDTLGLSPTLPTDFYGNYFWTNLNGFSTWGVSISDGDVLKYGDAHSGIGYDMHDGYYYEYAWTTVPTPVSVPETTPEDPVDATIALSDILYWVGSGSNSAALIVSYAEPEVALAWGVHFDGSISATDMLDSVQAADPRFWYVGNPSNGGDIHFVTDDGDTLGLSPTLPTDFYDNYFWTNLNGFSTWGTNITDGDVLKYGDAHSGIGYDMHDGYYYEYAWTTVPTPVSVPETTPEDPVDATIALNDILYWVGSGNNSAALIVSYAEPEVALAWGVHFDGSISATDMLDSVQAADPRFWYVGNPSNGGDIHFVTDDGDTLGLSPTLPTDFYDNYFWTNLNGFSTWGVSISDGDVLKYGDAHSGIGYDMHDGYYYEYAWTTVPTPVSVPDTGSTPVVPVPEEATIAFSDILFWVGEGTNEAVLAVNWADTALAWGYRWNGEATVATMMDHIAAADPRFSYTGVGFMNDINYIDTAAGMTTPLGITPGNIWESKNNGNMDSGLGQVLSNGDIEKWADPAAGIVVDSISYLVDSVTIWFNIYVYPMTIYPVTVPDTTGSGPGPDPQPEHGPFCGPVGTEGCNAIAYDDNAFVAWATNVVVTRGPQSIANPDGPLASFGSDSNAIGPASMDNMDAVSLGDGGSALVTFERPIRNGEGPDFAVFENDNNGGFLELAFVEVSSDGMHFVRFPATSLTQTETQIGTFGLSDPTFINNLAGKFQIGYGTPFDLEELRDSANINIDSIVYVRIVDVVGSINPLYATYDAFGHMVNDPWPTNFWTSGFDLTGVGVIHSLNVGIDEHQISHIYAYPNPCTGTLHIVNDNAEKVELYNMNGKLLEMVNDGETRITLNMEQYPAGLYLLKVGNGVQKILKK